MVIFASLGDDVKEAAARLLRLMLEACPKCGAAHPAVLDSRMQVVPCGRRAGEPTVVEVWCWRYRCRRCGARVTVSADCLLPRGGYPGSVRDWVVTQYVNGQATYAELAAMTGASKSTCWRWVRAMALRAGQWVETCREQVAAAGVPVGPLVLPESKRALWQRRRVRAKGMVEGLLLAEALQHWVEQLRAAWRQRPGVRPAGLWAFAVHILDRLNPSRPMERHGPP